MAPDSRIVYVDNDPLVLTHARALLTSTPEGACQYIDAEAYAIANRLMDALPSGSYLALNDGTNSVTV